MTSFRRSAKKTSRNRRGFDLTEGDQDIGSYSSHSVIDNTATSTKDTIGFKAGACDFLSSGGPTERKRADFLETRADSSHPSQSANQAAKIHALPVLVSSPYVAPVQPSNESAHTLLPSLLHIQPPNRTGASSPNTEKRRPPVAGSMLTLETRITITLCGEIILYDLEALGPDPTAIIKLLQASCSERGNWMAVSCHYRRTGNPRAAIKVVDAMLECIECHGLDADHLAPAYILLGACEMDLARIITEPVIAAKHEANAVAYFRKVYGESGCETASPTKASGPNSRVPESMNANRQLPGNYNTFAAARPRTRTTLEPDGLHNLECSTKDYCDLQAMDRYPLSDAHALECEFYSELMKERKRNETLEDEVRHIRKQLEVSKRAERAALQQVKVEIVARRKAELRAEHERPRRKEESFVGARVVKPLFGDLVNILQNVVEGDKQAALQACHHPPAAADPAPVS